MTESETKTAKTADIVRNCRSGDVLIAYDHETTKASVKITVGDLPAFNPQDPGKTPEIPIVGIIEMPWNNCFHGKKSMNCSLEDYSNHSGIGWSRIGDGLKLRFRTVKHATPTNSIGAAVQEIENILWQAVSETAEMVKKNELARSRFEAQTRSILSTWKVNNEES